jgi:Domain of unknown function (DUF222)/HNH endonuclease
VDVDNRTYVRYDRYIPQKRESGMPVRDDRFIEDLIREMDGVNARVCSTQRHLFQLIAHADAVEVWRDSGARDMAHWLCMRYGISHWKASRWIKAAHALEELPKLSEAFTSGALGIDKVVELSRFATPETEDGLVGWAQGVSCGCIRSKADLADRSLEEAREAQEARSVRWWTDRNNARFGLSAELPAAEGAVVAKALSRLADVLPIMPGEKDEWFVEARRADALVAICSAAISSDPDPDRATVVIHARLDSSGKQIHSAEVEGGPAIYPEVARRLACTGRIQVLLEDETGQPIRLGRISREPPEWMIRQLKYRDRECTFPSCGARRFTQAHHIVWWDRGGATDLDNLVLVCTFHHKLVHEYGWRLVRHEDGTVEWFGPDGVRYRAGPSPPSEEIELGESLLRVIWAKALH